MTEDASPAESEVIDRFCQALAQALRRLLSSEEAAVPLADLPRPIDVTTTPTGDYHES